MFAVSNTRFEELAAAAVASLPPELARHVDNVAILIEDQAATLDLYGLYEGIPLTRRSMTSYSGVLPDRITLYQSTICRDCSSEDEVKAQITRTVIHEVAHHFGISDQRLTELGWG